MNENTFKCSEKYHEALSKKGDTVCGICGASLQKDELCVVCGVRHAVLGSDTCWMCISPLDYGSHDSYASG